MPLITPPNDEGYPESVREELPESGLTDYENNRRIQLFLNIQPWLCPACGLTNFGRNLKCADWRCKTPRPADFVNRRKYE